METPGGNSKEELTELYFVVARFLESGPCAEAARVLKRELSANELLPTRKDWLGRETQLTYKEAVSRAHNVKPDHLQQMCGKLLQLLKEGGQLRANGPQSLTGSSTTACIRNSQTKDVSLRRTAFRLHKYSTSHHRQQQPMASSYHVVCARQITPGFPRRGPVTPQLYRNLKKHRVILGHLAPVFCVLFDHTGQCIITGADDDLLKVWSSRTGQLLATLRGHSAEVTDISLSCDNSMIASGSLDRSVRVWCALTSAPIAVLIGHQSHVTSVQFSSSPIEKYRYLASTGKDGFLCFWQWLPDSMNFSPTPIKFMEKNRMGDQTLCSAFSPGGKYFVTGGTDRLIRIYVCIPGPPTLMAELPGHSDRIMTVQFGHTGEGMFATGSCDGTTRVWSYKEAQWSSITLEVTKDELAMMAARPGKKEQPQVTMVGWERTDTFLVTAFSPDCVIRVWNSQSGELLHKLEGHGGEIFVLEPHPADSRILLSAGHDGRVIIWDTLAGVKISVLMSEDEEGATPCIFDCKLSPDGLMCAAVDSSGFLTLFGFGSSLPYQQHPREQFFHTDYRPLMRDRNHYVIDEQSQLPPHLLPPPYLVNIDGHAHHHRYQEHILKQVRLVERVKQERTSEEIDDYDEYMKKHLAMVKQQSFGFTRARLNQLSSLNRFQQAGSNSGGSSNLRGREESENMATGSSEPQSNHHGAPQTVNSTPQRIDGASSTQNSDDASSSAPHSAAPTRTTELSPLRNNGATSSENIRATEPTEVLSSQPQSSGEAGTVNTSNGCSDKGLLLPSVGETSSGTQPQNDLSSSDVEETASAPQPATAAGERSEGVSERAEGRGSCSRDSEDAMEIAAAGGGGEEEDSNDDDDVIEVVDEEEEEEEEGGADEVMLSSLVYSMGLTEDETKQAISLWHNRTIIPSLEPSQLACRLAQQRDIYQEEERRFEAESNKGIMEDETTSPEVVPDQRGRALRSGRTLQDATASDGEGGERGGLEEEEEESEGGETSVDSESDGPEAWGGDESTASSDISDWTTDVGLSMISPVRKRTKRVKKASEPLDSEESNEEEEEDGDTPPSKRAELRKQLSEGQSSSWVATGDGTQPPRKKSRKPPIKSVDYAAYWPPDWLKQTRPQMYPYFPQVGDTVMYFRQGHELYVRAVKAEQVYPVKNVKMPWQKLAALSPHERCQVTNVHFTVGPPTLCSITLAPLGLAPGERTTFTFKYHDMAGVLDFLVLERVFRAAVQRQWAVGEKFRSFIDGGYWYGSVTKRQAFQEDFPGSYWQCYHVLWEDGATDQLSPWDMEPPPPPQADGEDIPDGRIQRLLSPATGSQQDSWTSEDGEEAKRILAGLAVVSELDEAVMFKEPVDLEEVPTYALAVPFPTDLATIAERLQNDFYRRKIALLWEVVQLARNALLFNEEDSLIVKHARVLVHTLSKFITTPTCTDPLEFYEQEPVGEVEEAVEVAPPDVSFTTGQEEEGEGETPSSPDQEPPTPSPPSPPVKGEPGGGEGGDWRGEAEGLINALMKNENAFLFLEPVDTDKYNDYLSVIERPMDLGTVAWQLREGIYSTPQEFTSDVQLIFQNAMAYNRKSSEVYKMTLKLQSFFDAFLPEFLRCQTLSIKTEGPAYSTRRRTLECRANSIPSSSSSSLQHQQLLSTSTNGDPLEGARSYRKRLRSSQSRISYGENDEESSPEEEEEEEEEEEDLKMVAEADSWSVDLSVTSTTASVSSKQETRTTKKADSHGMSLRSRGIHMARAESREESEEEEEEEASSESDEDNGLPVRKRRRRRGRRKFAKSCTRTTQKRTRVCSDSDVEYEKPLIVTRGGRVVKPASKF